MEAIASRIKVQLRRPWPRIPEGDYTGPVVGWGRGPAPWGKRTKRDGQKVHDHHVYMHVCLDEGATPALREALEDFKRRHGRSPVVYYACRYEVSGDGIPLPIGRSSKLHELLKIVGKLRDE